MKLISKKNIIKSVIYRLYAFIITFVVALLVTGNVELSATIGVIENFFKIATYYWFDILWDKFTIKKYKKSILWFTGLSGSGKTTIAKEIVKKLQEEGQPVMLLDGDEIRDIFKNTGFDKESRLRHINDVAKMAVYLQKKGIIPIVSLISPYTESRENAKKLSDDFLEIYVDTSLVVCEMRDVKGLYKKARAGEITNFTGIHESSPYEVPTNPDIIVHTSGISIEACVEKVLNKIKK